MPNAFKIRGKLFMKAVLEKVKIIFDFDPHKLPSWVPRRAQNSLEIGLAAFWSTTWHQKKFRGLPKPFPDLPGCLRDLLRIYFSHLFLIFSCSKQSIKHITPPIALFPCLITTYTNTANFSSSLPWQLSISRTIDPRRPCLRQTNRYPPRVEKHRGGLLKVSRECLRALLWKLIFR